ncbi:glycosyltransferase family A protein [Paraglaciecola sp. 20A4]|uniref:glycosyltransferase family A protein n=1 Tax=Paraglaciecola sp. 20A4 TaxID=2687288 RepID=UPI00140D2D7B|nr:glycosyltransferase family A protein [Paraglaciecola sp. 20A4]
MIAFIVAFRHPNSTKNYNHVVQLLKATIESLLNQINDDFKVYIGCNEIPEIDVVDSKVRFCPIDCPLPNNRKEVLLDKGVKRAFAIQTANTEIAPEFFFLLDADDLVRNDCVEYLDNLPQIPSHGGYWLERGYLLDMFNRKAQEKYGFNRYCGSSLILSAKVLSKALFLDREYKQPMVAHEEFMNACDPYVLEQVLGDHIAVRGYMITLGYPLKKIVRPLVCWKINTGENESRTKIPFGSKNMDRKFLGAFSIPIEYERNTHISEAIIERYRFVSSWIASKWASYK